MTKSALEWIRGIAVAAKDMAAYHQISSAPANRDLYPLYHSQPSIHYIGVQFSGHYFGKDTSIETSKFSSSKGHLNLLKAFAGPWRGKPLEEFIRSLNSTRHPDTAHFIFNISDATDFLSRYNKNPEGAEFKNITDINEYIISIMDGVFFQKGHGCNTADALVLFNNQARETLQIMAKKSIRLEEYYGKFELFKLYHNKIKTTPLTPEEADAQVKAAQSESTKLAQHCKDLTEKHKLALEEAADKNKTQQEEIQQLRAQLEQQNHATAEDRQVSPSFAEAPSPSKNDERQKQLEAQNVQLEKQLADMQRTIGQQKEEISTLKEHQAEVSGSTPPAATEAHAAPASEDNPIMLNCKQLNMAMSDAHVGNKKTAVQALAANSVVALAVVVHTLVNEGCTISGKPLTDQDIRGLVEKSAPSQGPESPRYEVSVTQALTKAREGQEARTV